MDLREARALAMDLMEQHGLETACFEWMNKKARLGEAQQTGLVMGVKCSTLRLNRRIAAASERDDVEQTILHEIAHLLVGCQHHHDRIWKMKAYAIGYRGARTSDVPAEVHVEQNWIGICPAGHLSSRTRRPKEGRKISCGKCSRRYSEAHLISWVEGRYYRQAKAQIAAQEQS